MIPTEPRNDAYARDFFTTKDTHSCGAIIQGVSPADFRIRWLNHEADCEAES